MGRSRGTAVMLLALSSIVAVALLGAGGGDGGVGAGMGGFEALAHPWPYDSGGAAAGGDGAHPSICSNVDDLLCMHYTWDMTVAYARYTGHAMVPPPPAGGAHALYDEYGQERWPQTTGDMPALLRHCGIFLQDHAAHATRVDPAKDRHRESTRYAATWDYAPSGGVEYEACLYSFRAPVKC